MLSFLFKFPRNTMKIFVVFFCIKIGALFYVFLAFVLYYILSLIDLIVRSVSTVLYCLEYCIILRLYIYTQECHKK